MSIFVYRDSINGKELLGKITLLRPENSPNRSFYFQYEKDFLTSAQQHHELGISESLPLREEPYTAHEASSFFSGLLPEGKVIEHLAKAYQVPRNDYVSILEQLGCESIGALTFISENIDESEYRPSYSNLSNEVFASAKESPELMATQTAASTRLSLAGAQSKVAWYLPPDIKMEDASMSDWLIPKGTAPSTHIIKITRRGEEELAKNEYACSVFSTSCQINTARVSILEDLPGAISIERYDRVWIEDENNMRVLRLHQEDFCQALGFPTYFKYQPDSVEADYLIYISDLIDTASCRPYKDKLEFAKRLVFNYVIGNTDAHLKNSSFLYNKGWTEKFLAPMYDVTCIPLTGYSTKMPFNIGTHRELSDIDENDLLHIALDLDLSLDDYSKEVLKVFNGFNNFSLATNLKSLEKMCEKILDNSRKRLKVVKTFLG